VLDFELSTHELTRNKLLDQRTDRDGIPFSFSLCLSLYLSLAFAQ